MREVRENHISNEQLRERLDHIESLDGIDNVSVFIALKNGRYTSNKVRTPPPHGSYFLILSGVATT